MPANIKGFHIRINLFRVFSFEFHSSHLISLHSLHCARMSSVPSVSSLGTMIGRSEQFFVCLIEIVWKFSRVSHPCGSTLYAYAHVNTLTHTTPTHTFGRRYKHAYTHLWDQTTSENPQQCAHMLRSTQSVCTCSFTHDTTHRTVCTKTYSFAQSHKTENK